MNRKKYAAGTSLYWLYKFDTWIEIIEMLFRGLEGM